MRSSLIERYFWPRRTFISLTPEQADYASARVVVLPIPYDAASSGASVGAREGPLAIVNASQEIETYDLELERVPGEEGIHTLPDVIPVLTGPEDMLTAVREVTGALLEDGKTVVALGGDHSLTVGLVAAHLRRFPGMGVLCLDAHGDLLDEYLGTRYSHASTSRRVLEMCPLVQVGVRSAGPDEASLVRERRRLGHLFTMDDLRDDARYVDRVVASLPREVYVSVDLDVFDPSIMAAVDLPEPGGMLYQEAVALLRKVAAERTIVGFDVMELSPREGPRACAYLAAKLAYKLIGYLTAPRV
jgi:agmatinase